MGPAALALAAGIGFSLGLLGGGGSILVVPALTFLMGFDAKQAVVTSLAAVGIAAAAGAMASYFRGTLPVKPAMSIGLATMVGAFGGARIGAGLPDRTQLMILATVMLGTAAAMLHRSFLAGDRPVRVTSKRPLALGALGVVIGMVTGMVGVGGGFLIVPALVLAAGLPMREASSSFAAGDCAGQRRRPGGLRRPRASGLELRGAVRNGCLRGYDCRRRGRPPVATTTRPADLCGGPRRHRGIHAHPRVSRGSTSCS